MRTLFPFVCCLVFASCTTTSGDVGEGEGEGEALIGEGEGEVSFSCPTPVGVGGCETVEGAADCPRNIPSSDELGCDTPLIHCTFCNFAGTGRSHTIQCGDESRIAPYRWQGLSDPSCFSEGM
jgi:hypothetical protein